MFFGVVIMVLAGCSHIPGTESGVSDVRGTAPMIYASNLKDSVAAKCIMKNIDDHLAFMSASLSTDDSRPNLFEIRSRSKIGFAAIVEIEAAENGSKITTWISNHYARTKGIMANKITEGCRQP